MLTQSAIAVFSAVLGCVVTLFTVGAFSHSESDIERVLEVESAQPLVISAPVLTQDYDVELQRLQAALTAGEQERSQMVETLVQLTRDLADVQTQVIALEQTNTQGLVQLNEQNSVSPQANGSSPRSFNPSNQRQSGQERVESLVAAGIDEQTALDMQVRRDQQQLARLELLDQAAREGWSDSEQLQERMAELNAGTVDLREEVGDEAYDRFLYESGDANRVNIASVITGSAANIAGLEVGDAIISYDNRRIFRVRELQQATRQGTKGEYVQILFDRAGQFLSADLPRGPLGVTLGTSLVTP